MLALIVSGEPNASEDGGKPGFQAEDECFPEALRYRWGGHGELSTGRTEPIAADARPGKDGKRNVKLKLLAGLLQVDYDGLRQREHERRVRQLSYLVAAALGLLVVFAGLAVYSEVQRQRAERATQVAQEQRQYAEAQRQKAEEQEQEANRQREVAKQEAHRVKVNTSRSDFVLANQFFRQDKADAALAYLGRALRTDPENRAAAVRLYALLRQSNWPRLLAELHDENGLVRSAAFSPDGGRIVTAYGQQSARLWNARTGQPVAAPMRHGSEVTWAVFSPDGKQLLTAASGEVHLWNTEMGAAIGTAIVLPEVPVQVAAFNPDGSLIFTGAGAKLSVWHAADGSPAGPAREFKGEIITGGLSLDAGRIVSCDQNTAYLWEVPTGRQIGKPMPHANHVGAVAFSPDGSKLATGSADDTLRLWDANTGLPLSQPADLRGDVRRVCFSPDGKYLAAVSFDGNCVGLWDVGANQLVKIIPLNGNGYWAEFSLDSRWLLTSSGDGTARLWNAATGARAAEPMRHQDLIESARFSPSGEQVVTASWDQTARVWDIRPSAARGERRQPQQSFDRNVSRYRGPFDAKMVRSHDGTRALSLEIARIK